MRSFFSFLRRNVSTLYYRKTFYQNIVIRQNNFYQNATTVIDTNDIETSSVSLLNKPYLMTLTQNKSISNDNVIKIQKK